MARRRRDGRSWGAAYVLIGGVGAGTVLTLLFLPALYAVWFKIERRRSPATSRPTPAPIGRAMQSIRG